MFRNLMKLLLFLYLRLNKYNSVVLVLISVNEIEQNNDAPEASIFDTNSTTDQYRKFLTINLSGQLFSFVFDFNSLSLSPNHL